MTEHYDNLVMTDKAIKELLIELGGKKAGDWEIINDGLNKFDKVMAEFKYISEHKSELLSIIDQIKEG